MTNSQSVIRRHDLPDHDLAAEQRERRTDGRQVLLYVKTLPGEDPSPHFRSLRAAAARSGLTVVGEVYDDAGRVDPFHSESQWPSVEKRLRNCEAHGVLVVSERHVSMDSFRCRAALDRVDAVGAFTALLCQDGFDPDDEGPL
ncbi:MAG: hypothetical protein LBV60_05000 [Streptomyces sp.]|jgi:hypothetical protein|nr:hypothetical protein [Streptomyces sp.]